MHADSLYHMSRILFQTLVSICTSLILQERAAAAVSVAANLPFAPILSPPQYFADTVIKLASRLMHVMKEQCSLKELCGNTINFGGPTRTEKIFVRLILPTCIRLGSGRTGKATLVFLLSRDLKRNHTVVQNRLRGTTLNSSVDFFT